MGSSKLIAINSKKSLHSCKDCEFFCEGEWEEQSQQPKHNLVDHYGVIGHDDLINLINLVGKTGWSCLIGLKLMASTATSSAVALLTSLAASNLSDV